MTTSILSDGRLIKLKKRREREAQDASFSYIRKKREVENSGKIGVYQIGKAESEREYRKC